ncbi:uncharacterized protein LOC122643585 [Telopea speciosissima]|uniref:uncharacterized protein LOC122643585 n=1 Tax=Telopea speciosissima TaxID=54955 RepID=UPI001CC3DA6C|nr:uncharacterized protein LOC122643585 [Telopea speciosissima]
MNMKIAALEKGTTPEESFRLGQHPFTVELMRDELLKGFKPPTFEAYDGKVDPNDHISYFNSMMTVYGGSDVVSCHSFPTSLKGPAALWFAKLKPNSIQSFTELAKAFVSRFQSSVKKKKTATNLLAVKQRSDESIRDYITRFNAESLEIKDLDDAMAFNALHNGVTNHDLVKSLALDPMTTMLQLLDRCYQYANMFDIMKARKAVDGKAPKKRRASEKDEKKGTKRARFDRDQSPDYTPLNTTKTKILMEDYDRGLLQWPRPMFSNPEDRNKNKYCKFHKDVGHDIEDCRGVTEIEDVIQKGHLKHYVKGDMKENSRGREAVRNDRRGDNRARRRDDRGRQDDRRDDHREVRRNQDEGNMSMAPAILTILGGPGQELARKAKAKARFVVVAEVPEKKA